MRSPEELRHDAATIAVAMQHLDAARMTLLELDGALHDRHPMRVTLDLVTAGINDCLSDLQDSREHIDDELAGLSTDDGRPGTARLSYAGAV